MKDHTSELIKNPLRDTLINVQIVGIDNHLGLEKTYHIVKSKKALVGLKLGKPCRNDLFKIDHNAFLDMYPEYEYIFGPFMDSSDKEFNLVYLLYTNQLNAANKIKVVYAARVLKELKAGCVLELSLSDVGMDG
jgi:hypothetical protein